MDYICFGTVGGLTGGKHSKKLYVDGTLVKVVQIVSSSPEVETPIKNVDAETVTKIQQLFNPTVLHQNFNKSSNMSYTLTYKLGNATYRWTCPISEVPNFLKVVIDELNKL